MAWRMQEEKEDVQDASGCVRMRADVRDMDACGVCLDPEAAPVISP
jgi:hypothetical protein